MSAETKDPDTEIPWQGEKKDDSDNGDNMELVELDLHTMSTARRKHDPKYILKPHIHMV